MSCPLVNTVVSGSGNNYNMITPKLVPTRVTETAVSGSGDLVNITSNKFVSNMNIPQYAGGLYNLRGGNSIPNIIPTTFPTSISNTTPTSISNTTPTVIPNTTPTSISNTTPTSISTTIPTVIPTVIPNTIPTVIPNTTPTVIPNTIPTIVSKQNVTTNPIVQNSELNCSIPYSIINNGIPNPTTNCCNSGAVSPIDITLGVNRVTCHPRGAPWPMIIMGMIGGGMLLYTILMAPISNSRRQFLLGIIILWTLLWMVIFWSLWRRCYTTVIWWLLLFAITLLTFIFVVMAVLDLGSA